MKDITRRLEALERDIVPRDDSNRADIDEMLGILAGKKAGPDKPKQEKSAKPVDPELEKLLDSYAKYKETFMPDWAPMSMKIGL